MTRFEKWMVLLASLATVLTGTAYLWVKYFVQPTEPWAVVNHPAQPWLLKAHILVSPLLVFAVGAIAVRHVWQHFRRGVAHGRRSGVAAGAVFLPMVLSGYLIQSVTAEGWVQAMAWTHLAASGVYAVGIAAHAAVVLRRTGRAPALRGGGLPAEELTGV